MRQKPVALKCRYQRVYTFIHPGYIDKRQRHSGNGCDKSTERTVLVFPLDNEIRQYHAPDEEYQRFIEIRKRNSSQDSHLADFVKLFPTQKECYCMRDK